MTQNATNYLLKNSDFKYDENEIFKNDFLDRKVIIENLSNLIWSATQSFVISIESPWGTGKTVFVKLWKQYLEKKNTPCIYFNAWENDFVSDPIIPFISTLDEYVKNEIKNIDDSKIKNSLDKAKHLGAYIAKKSLPVILKIGTQGLLNVDTEEVKKILSDEQLKEIPGLMSDIAEDAIEEFSKKKNSINELKKKIKEISGELVSENNKKPPLVIFIDELDRCRPDFALLLLERLKHIFSVDGVVFVISVDRKQLESSVKAIYGGEIDACGYLLRFIDYRFKLPNGKIENYSIQLFYKYSIPELIQKRRTTNSNYDQNYFIECINLIVKVFKLSLRELEKIFTEFNLLLRILKPETVVLPGAIFFLLSVKIKDFQFFEKLIEKQISIDKIEKKMEELEVTLNKNEKDQFHQLQGLFVRFISTDVSGESILDIPNKYKKIDGDNTGNWSYNSGFNIDIHKMWNIVAVINEYLSKISLIKEFN